jgi:uncharacterized protein YaaR (DUF327 family)
MSRSQKYISILLERLPKWELRSYEHQTCLDQIRDKISSASDIQAELESLYNVQGFADFALSLLWIADKVEKDPTLEESTLKEETLVFEKFRQGIGDVSETSEDEDPIVSLSGLPSSESEPVNDAETEFISEPSTTPEPTLDTSWATAFQSPEQSNQTNGDSTPGIDQERAFAHLLERFMESVQSGSEDRLKLISDLIANCKTIIASGTAVEDYRQFCELLVEFLEYISDNQYLDDVRVMNIVSNIQLPVTQWAQSEADNRTGILTPAIDVIRDYKTMFE